MILRSAFADDLSLESLSSNKSPQVNRILLSILADLNNALIWMISICHLISSSLFSKPFWTVSSVSIITGITVTPMFHSYFSSLAESKYLSLFLLSLIFNLWYTRTAKSTKLQSLSLSLFFFFCSLSQDLVFEPELDDLFISQNPR